jgi:hypothetical protein
MAKLSIKEKATNYETMVHIRQVQRRLNKVAAILVDRGHKHDRSKLESPEVEYFTKYTDELKTLTYNSDEYKACLEKMKPALDSHYAKNRHHPDHFPDGVNGMNLIDITEMVCDWIASTERQNDGNIQQSFTSACKRFKIGDQLASIIKNTIDVIEGENTE